MQFTTHVAVIWLLVASVGLSIAAAAGLIPCTDGDRPLVMTMAAKTSVTVAVAPMSRPIGRHLPSSPPHCRAASPFANVILSAGPILIDCAEMVSRIAPPPGEKWTGMMTPPLLDPPRIRSWQY